MEKLFIANTSKHDQEINYWVGEASRFYTEMIKIGQQIQVYNSPKATKSDLDHIVEQLETYGLKNVTDISKNTKYAGLCYRWNRPVDIESILSGVAGNDELMIQQALEDRKNGAAAVHHLLNERSNGAVSEVEMEVVEQAKPGDEEDAMQETISSINEGVTPRKARAGRGR